MGGARAPAGLGTADCTQGPGWTELSARGAPAGRGIRCLGGVSVGGCCFKSLLPSASRRGQCSGTVADPGSA